MVTAARGGKHQLGTFALEQAPTELLLQQLNLTADSALGDVQLLSGAAEILMPGSGIEDPNGVQ